MLPPKPAVPGERPLVRVLPDDRPPAAAAVLPRQLLDES